MVAFISSTPHQTWDAIVMIKKMFPDEKCDLYLIDDCENYLETIELLKKENIFEDIVPCNVQNLFCAKYKKSYIRKIRRALYFIGWRGYLRKYAPIKKKKYSKVFLAVHDEARCFMLTRMHRLNPQIEACYYEDGANDYLCASHNKHTGKKVTFAKLVGLNYNVGNNIKKAYVLNPECVATEDFEFLPIPRIDTETDKELIEILNRVFKYKPYEIKEKVVYLYNRIVPVAKDLERIIQGISEKYGQDSIILKDHPRLPASGYEGVNRIPKENETLWEGMCMNNDFSDKILISHCSTSLYIPKFVFDQEPTLIFLFNMLKVRFLERSGRRESFEIFVEKLRSTYRDKSKVFLPETEEELNKYLEKIMKKDE